MLSVEEREEPQQPMAADTHMTEASTTTKKMDEESKKRGKRMMGVLMGTLSQFKKSDAADSTGIRQRQIQRKLLEKLAEERVLLAEQVERERKERREAAQALKAKHMEESSAAMQRVRQEGEAAQRCFLRTAAGPSLFYLPAVLLESQEEALRKQQQQDMHD